MTGIPYPIIQIAQNEVIGDEQLGTKTKFWFERDGVRWLFKEAREINDPRGVTPTGEDWAEKVAAEIAHVLQIRAAEVELAEFEGRRGCASRNFTSASQQLMHGNEVLAGYVAGYDRDKRFRQSAHTLENIILAIRGMFPDEAENRTVLTDLASYLVLDALIGNVDRHHENWGLLWQVRVEMDDFRETAWLSKEYDVAPSFDHASALGRELLDEKRSNLLRSGAVEAYVRKGRGGIYRQGEPHGANPLHLVALAARKYPDYFEPVLKTLSSVPLERLTEPLDRIPDERITPPARAFGKAMVAVAYEHLIKVAK
jgi:hypothetical protein